LKIEIYFQNTPSVPISANHIATPYPPPPASLLFSPA